MISDTEEELHAMAQGIGMKREWFQGPPNHFPHYDLSPRKQHIAIKKGAKLVGRREIIEIIRRIRDGQG